MTTLALPHILASHLLGVGLLLFVAFVWGSMFVVVKGLTAVLPTADLMAWRYLLAALPMLFFLRRAPSPRLWQH